MDIHLISEARYQNLLAIIAHQNHTTPERVEADLDAALQSACPRAGDRPRSTGSSGGPPSGSLSLSLPSA